MNENNKYELIVGLRKLIKDSRINKFDELKNSLNISLNASKIMQFVYNSDELTNYFIERVNRYKELKADAETYDKFITRHQDYIKCSTPEKYREGVCFFDDLIFCNYYYSDDDYKSMLELYNEYIFQNYVWSLSYCIGAFLDTVHREYWDNADKNTEEYKNFIVKTIDNKFEVEKVWFLGYFNSSSEFEQNIDKYYDYYFLYNIEQDTFYDEKFNIYVYVAYNNVLYDLLEYAYNIDLSEQEIEQRKQKQEQLRKKQQREQFICKLTDAEKDLFEFIENNLDLSVKEIAGRMNKSENTIKKQIRNIMENTNNKKGGLKDLKKLVRLFS